MSFFYIIDGGYDTHANVDDNLINNFSRINGVQHFMFGGNVKGGHVLGKYPDNFEQGDPEQLALSRGRMIPTSPWDAMWLGVAQWFGIPYDKTEGAANAEMETILPMHKNFPKNILYDMDALFCEGGGCPTSSPTDAPLPTFSPTLSAGPTNGVAAAAERSYPWE